jgi:hypothetical protein
MRSRYLLAAGAATAALLASAPTFAQLQPAIVIAFTGASSVPLGPWTSVAAALFIVVVAATIFRRRRAGRPMHPGTWLAVIAAVGAAAIAGLPGDAIRAAHAIIQPLPGLVLAPGATCIVQTNVLS